MGAAALQLELPILVGVPLLMPSDALEATAVAGAGAETGDCELHADGRVMAAAAGEGRLQQAQLHNRMQLVAHLDVLLSQYCDKLFGRARRETWA